MTSEMLDIVRPETCIVAYLDVLGTTQAIKENSAKYLQLFHNIYEDTINALATEFKAVQWRPVIKIFSDNIVMAIPFPEKKATAVFKLIAMLCATFQLQFLGNDFAVRGCMTFGDFFSDQYLVWGNALVDSSRGEENEAIYPRVIIRKELLSAIKERDPLADLSDFVQEDFDGYSIVDFFTPNKLMKDGTFELLQTKIHKNLDEYKSNERIYSKWQWLAQKFMVKV